MSTVPEDLPEKSATQIHADRSDRSTVPWNGDCRYHLRSGLLPFAQSGGRTATILVRRLDGEAVRRLEQRAAGDGRPLESEVRHILERAAGDDIEEKRRAFRELSKKMRELTSDVPIRHPTLLIREARDSAHWSA